MQNTRAGYRPIALLAPGSLAHMRLCEDEMPAARFCLKLLELRTYCAGNIEEDVKLLQSRELGDAERLAVTLRLQEKRVAQVPSVALSSCHSCSELEVSLMAVSCTVRVRTSCRNLNVMAGDRGRWMRSAGGWHLSGGSLRRRVA